MRHDMASVCSTGVFESVVVAVVVCCGCRCWLVGELAAEPNFQIR
jgi:hypothetical protein